MKLAGSQLLSSLRSNSKSGSKKSSRLWYRLKPRTELLVLFVALQSFVIIQFYYQIKGVQSSLARNFQATAADQVAAGAFAYGLKVNQVGLGFKGQAKNLDIINLLNNGGSTVTVQKILQFESVSRSIELVYVLDTDMKVIVGNNGNGLILQGQIHDPDGVVSLLKNNITLGQIKKSGIISYASLQSQAVPIYRERTSELQAAMINIHPIDIRSSSLIRYTVTPVLDITSLLTVKPLIGYLLTGDIVNGKAQISTAVTDVLGGYLGVYMKNPNAVQGSTKRIDMNWLPATHSFSFKLPKLTEYAITDVNYDAAERDHEWFDNHLNTVNNNIKTQTPVVAQDILSAYAMIPLPTYGDYGTGNTEPDAVIVRGINIFESEFLSKAVLIMILFMICMVIADALVVFTACYLFIKPLEQLARFLRMKGAQIDLDHLRALAKRKNYMGIVLLLSLVSPAIALGLLFYVKSNVSQALSLRSESEPGIINLSYRLKMSQMSLGFFGQSTNGAIKGLLNDPNDTVLRSTVQTILLAEINNRRIEYATLVDKNMKIVLSPNTDRIGDEFNPGNLVSDVLTYKSRFLRTTTVPYMDLVTEGSRVWNETVSLDITASALHPSVTKKDALIRYTATPVWIGTSNDKTLPVDGVLISGDIVNGKTAIPERSNTILTRGYSAIYYWTKADGFQLATSARMQHSNDIDKHINTDVDIELPSKGIALLQKVHDYGYASTKVATDKLSISGVDYYTSVKCVFANSEITSFGRQDEITSFDGVNECTTFFVQAMPVGTVSGIYKEAMLWHYIGLALQACKTIGLLLICKKAYKHFSTVVVRNVANSTGTKIGSKAIINNNNNNNGNNKSRFSMLSNSFHSGIESVRQSFIDAAGSNNTNSNSISNDTNNHHHINNSINNNQSPNNGQIVRASFKRGAVNTNQPLHQPLHQPLQLPTSIATSPQGSPNRLSKYMSPNRLSGAGAQKIHTEHALSNNNNTITNTNSNNRSVLTPLSPQQQQQHQQSLHTIPNVSSATTDHSTSQTVPPFNTKVVQPGKNNNEKLISLTANDLVQ